MLERPERFPTVREHTRKPRSWLKSSYKPGHERDAVEDLRHRPDGPHEVEAGPRRERRRAGVECQEDL